MPSRRARRGPLSNISVSLGKHSRSAVDVTVGHELTERSRQHQLELLALLRPMIPLRSADHPDPQLYQVTLTLQRPHSAPLADGAERLRASQPLVLLIDTSFTSRRAHSVATPSTSPRPTAITPASGRPCIHRRARRLDGKVVTFPLISSQSRLTWVFESPQPRIV